MDTLQSKIMLLEKSVQTLEEIVKPESTATTCTKRNNTSSDELDHFACRMLVSATAAGFTQTQFKRCPDDYYDWKLEQRRAFLGAPSIAHLTKSIVFENTRFSGEEDSSDALRSRYLCCVVPYSHKIDSDALRSIIRRMHERRGLPIPSVKQFNYRLAADCVAITGYEPNAVTPLQLRTPMPVVIPRAITALDPGQFWLGGGQVSLKWNVQVEEFMRAFDPLVADIM